MKIKETVGHVLENENTFDPAAQELTDSKNVPADFIPFVTRWKISKIPPSYFLGCKSVRVCYPLGVFLFASTLELFKSW